MSLKVPEGWTTTTLGEIASITMGQSPKSSDTNDSGAGLPFLQGNAEFGFKHPTPVRWIEHPLKTAKAGDILFSVRAPVGEMNLAETDTCIGRGLSAVRATSADQSFLFSALYHYRNILRQHAQGSTFEAINGKNLRDMELLLPPLPEQRRIAEILYSVDEAIAATQAVIEQTRTVKQGVLKRLLTKGIGHTRFKQTEIGEIPEAWEVRRIGEIGQVQAGRQRSPHFTEGFARPYLRVANVFDGYIDDSDVLKMPFTDKEYERYRLVSGDILLNEGQSLELVGRNALYEGIPSNCCFQNTLVRFRSGPHVLAKFAYTLMQHLFATGQFMAIASRTTSVAHLGVKRYADLAVPVPPKDEQARIAEIHDQLTETLRTQAGKYDELLALKSALMSDLLTGRKRVPMSELAAAE